MLNLCSFLPSGQTQGDGLAANDDILSTQRWEITHVEFQLEM